MKDDLKLIIVNETTANSILSDSFTFGCLLAAFAANHYLLGDGIVLQIVMGVCFFIVVSAKSSRKYKRMDPHEALAYLQVRYEREPGKRSVPQ